MIDKRLVKNRFSANFKTYNENAFVQKLVVENLTKLIPYKNYGRVLELGCGTGLLTQKLDYLKAEKLYINDICEDVKKHVKPRNLEYEFIIGDAEEIEFPKNLDLIVSSNTIQWFENINNFFEKSAQALTPGSKLIFSTFTAGNYQQIADIFNVTLQYKTQQELAQEAEKYFDVKTAQSEVITLYFYSLKELLTHIKSTGANALSITTMTKSVLYDAERKYEKLRNNEGLPLTYTPAYFVLEKP